MLEAERMKADLAAIEEREAQAQKEREEAEKASFEESKKLLVKELTEEPTQGDIINVAIRLPDGSRLMRNFRKSEPVKVGPLLTQLMLAFIYSKPELDLAGKVRLFHDYPPVQISADDQEKTFGAMFENSDRQLITLHDESH